MLISRTDNYQGGSMGRKLFTVGRIVGKHGIKGTLRILPLTDFPERFANMEALDLYNRDNEFYCTLSVNNVRYLSGKGHFLIDTEEISTPEKALSLSGLSVKIKENERVKLEEGAYWVDDLVGISVLVADTEEFLGRVEEVAESGEYDLYIVRDEEGRLRYIPAVKKFIRSIDVSAGIMKVDLIEGL